MKSGDKLKNGIFSEKYCGGYTPNIEVTSRDRNSIIDSINNYVLIFEDSHKVWEVDLIFYK